MNEEMIIEMAKLPRYEIQSIMHWVDKLSKVLKDEVISEWVMNPNKAFDNQIPLVMIREGNTEPIERMISELE